MTAIAPRPSTRTGVTHVHDRALDRPFASIGDQLLAIVDTARDPMSRPDPRLLEINAAATGLHGGIASEGGFLLQEDLAEAAANRMMRDDPVLSRVTRVPQPRHTRKWYLPDEAARTNGNRFGGVVMEWLPEGETQTPTKPRLREVRFELKKLRGTAWLTQETAEDAPGSTAMLEQAFIAEGRFMLADAVVNGPGMGLPLGMTRTPALIPQAIEATQTLANSNTFIATNLAKMIARVPSWLASEIVVLYNNALLPTFVTATQGNTPMFVAGDGLGTRPDTIYGKPAFPSELCAVPGTPGDVMVIVPAEYYLSDRGARKVWSVEAGFLSDQLAIKVILRTDGMPLWEKSITPYLGAETLSPYIVLAARS